MAGLEDIPKQEMFSTPEGYFEKLPGKIQSRIAGSNKGAEVKFPLSYALPYALAVLVIFAGVWYYSFTSPSNAETILASVQTEELIIYLHETEISTDEVLDVVDFLPEELEAIENEAYDLGLEGMESKVTDKANED